MIKLPKKVADAIEKVEFELPEDEMLVRYMLTDWTWLAEKHNYESIALTEYFSEHPIEYITAIVEGYEVELTPEDKFIERYNELYKRKEELLSIHDSYIHINELEKISSYLGGMRETLNIFGIEIKDINA